MMRARVLHDLVLLSDRQPDLLTDARVVGVLGGHQDGDPVRTWSLAPDDILAVGVRAADHPRGVGAGILHPRDVPDAGTGFRGAAVHDRAFL
jgi:hypothetical protein